MPVVAKEVGNSPALLLNQLKMLFNSWGREKIYRTNEQLHEDMEGILSISTIKRAKQKLVEFGFIEISFDRGLKRQTFFKLTEKTKTLLHSLGKYNTKQTPVGFKNAEVNEEKYTHKDTKEEDSKIEKELTEKPYIKVTPFSRQDSKVFKSETTKTMKENFEEGFSNKNAVPNPFGSGVKLKDLKKMQKKECVNNKATDVVEKEVSILPKLKASLTKPLNNLGKSIIKYFDEEEELLELKRYNEDKLSRDFNDKFKYSFNA